ncbi:hypothetical protein P7K49_029997 [Saguinus oedipus]|uniref:Secreted protein n=1 Tax=Saguinus oedipus TaxID=9490 RepID=A0ABQ9U8U3_SAGOE|nr:hypothetical protein P7K49_029997 [Saguinus oedipus]
MKGRGTQGLLSALVSLAALRLLCRLTCAGGCRHPAVSRGPQRTQEAEVSAVRQVTRCGQTLFLSVCFSVNPTDFNACLGLTQTIRERSQLSIIKLGTCLRRAFRNKHSSFPSLAPQDSSCFVSASGMHAGLLRNDFSKNISKIWVSCQSLEKLPTRGRVNQLPCGRLFNPPVAGVHRLTGLTVADVGLVLRTATLCLGGALGCVSRLGRSLQGLTMLLRGQQSSGCFEFRPVLSSSPAILPLALTG